MCAEWNGMETNQQGINVILSKLFVTKWIILNSILSSKATLKALQDVRRKKDATKRSYVTFHY